jgi:phospholipase C
MMNALTLFEVGIEKINHDISWDSISEKLIEIFAKNRNYLQSVNLSCNDVPVKFFKQWSTMGEFKNLKTINLTHMRNLKLFDLKEVI